MRNSKICYRGFVEGRVQGVFFRAESRRQAQQLGLDGWVRNVDDGSVELLICGGEDQVRQMLAWLQAGPTMAEVETVSMAPSDCPVPTGFRIAD